MLELKPLTCQNCGGTIERSTMKCPYCGTQYARYHDAVTINYLVDRPGEHRLSAEVRVPRELAVNDPERATRYALDRLRHEVADGLLAYMKITTSKDLYGMSEIIRGEIKVLDPTFTY